MKREKVRYRGRKRYPKFEKEKIIPHLESNSKKWTIGEIIWIIFLLLLFLGMTYSAIKWLIGVL
jgi:hypothetical protein